LPPSGGSCPTCAGAPSNVATLEPPGDAPVETTAAAHDEEAIVAATLEEASVCELAEPECVTPSLAWRAAAVLVYALAGLACLYGSISFFSSPRTAWTDWIFGAMAIGLAFIALVGIKESIFPSNWKSE
jgi:hypothetical protein